jgi:putative ATP-dependent endonuclease of OLD family
MPIERVVIENFKAFGHLDLPLNPHMNLIVGNNEVGKSTLLEAIHAVVTGQLHGRGIAYEITPTCSTNRLSTSIWHVCGMDSLVRLRGS